MRWTEICLGLRAVAVIRKNVRGFRGGRDSNPWHEGLVLRSGSLSWAASPYSIQLHCIAREFLGSAIGGYLVQGRWEVGSDLAHAVVVSEERFFKFMSDSEF